MARRGSSPSIELCAPLPPPPPPDRRAAAAKAKLLSSRIRLRPVSRGGDGQIERIDIGDIAPIRYEDRNEDGIVIASRSFSIQFSINGRIPI